MRVSTGCECIDRLLGGGYEAGAITELYGEAGSGKTNLCLMAARTVINTGGKAIYIDSEGLSRERVRQVFGAGHEEMSRRLLVFEPYDFQEQEAVVARAVTLAMKNRDIGMLIVDSITGHYRIELAKDLERTERRSFIAQITSLLNLCRKRMIPVIITSQVYTDIDRGIFRPLGGHVLRHNAKAIVQLLRDQDIPGRREAVLMKHRSLAEGASTEFWITEDGVRCGPNGPD